MFWTRRNKEEHRYYLLPGMGRSNRRKHQEFLRWAIVVGAIVSAVFGSLLYYLSRNH
jgi:high-affinity Fe2+/Pb2+ permease